MNKCKTLEKPEPCLNAKNDFVLIALYAQKLQKLLILAEHGLYLSSVQQRLLHLFVSRESWSRVKLVKIQRRIVPCRLSIGFISNSYLDQSLVLQRKDLFRTLSSDMIRFAPGISRFTSAMLSCLKNFEVIYYPNELRVADTSLHSQIEIGMVFLDFVPKKDRPWGLNWSVSTARSGSLCPSGKQIPW